MRPTSEATVNKAKQGQAIIFLMIALVILVFVILWNFDVHRILRVKSKTQNAGDAAALVASRWQGITLNLVGDLNLMQALALGQGDTATAAAIPQIQARLCFVGPMIALMASQQAAKNNGMYVNPSFTDEMLDHARRVRTDYPLIIGPDGEPLFAEPYPGAWESYADMLDAVADSGIAAGPDNARYYTDYAGGHILLMPDFYDAIAGRTWCWFYHHAPELLNDYENFFPCWWSALPDPPPVQPVNSEIFGLGLTRLTTRLSPHVDPATLTGVMADRPFATPPSSNLLDISGTWYVYGEPWHPWTAIDATGPDSFPVTGTVKPVYDYAGADAAVRIESDMDRLSPGPGGTPVHHTILWTAAAKPFGSLNDEANRPNDFSLVLPAFREVRLIPVDASSMPAGGAYDIAWRRHVENHLPEYMRNGPTSRDCWYCEQLVTWEDANFRRDGSDWLDENSYRCIATGPGGTRGGGTRRGH